LTQETGSQVVGSVQASGVGGTGGPGTKAYSNGEPLCTLTMLLPLRVVGTV